jgi:hypothetical protein
MGRLLKHKKYLVALVIVGALISWLRYTYLPLELSGDYVSYIETAKFLDHVPGAGVYPQRILKPLSPIFTALIQDFSGSYDKAFFTQVYLLYLVLIILSLFFFREFFDKKLLPTIFCTSILHLDIQS